MMTSGVHGDPEISLLSEQMRDVHQSVLALGRLIEARTLEFETHQGSFRSDMLTVKQEQKELEEKLDCVICVLQHDLESLRSSSSANTRSVDELLQMVQELRLPVSEIIALRSRVAGLILGLGVLGSVTMWLAEPIYRWVVEHHFPK